MSERMVLAEPTLIGREKELQELQSFLNSAINGKGKTVFISGEAGSGKSRLAQEFLDSAKKKGVTVLTGWCLSNAAVPYFPFFEAFNAYFTGEPNEETEGATDITGWLKGPSQIDKGGKIQEISPQVWKDQTFAAVAKTLAAISTREPVILFLDDVHWADSASLALIHYLARAVDSVRVLILSTFRSELLTPDAEGKPHPLVETLRQMRREDLYKEIKVANLSQTSVSELAKSMLGGDIQQDFAEKLAQESQGNALFIVESVRMLHEHSCLAVERGKWQLSSGELSIPEKIKDIILQRLDMLSPSQRETLDAASVIGEEFDVNLLASVLGWETLGTAKTLDTVAKNTSLVNCKGETCMFDHARSRDAIYDEVSPALKRAYHSKVAEKLEEATKNSKRPLSELAYHYAQAGNKENAVKYAIAAGQDALARWSNTQAIQHFTFALLSLPEEHSEERRTALEGLGDAYAANGIYREAIKTFDRLADLEKGRLRLRAIRKAMDAAYFIWGESDLLLGYAKKAVELGVDDRLEMARILVNRGRAFGFAPSGNSEMDLADSDAALKVFEEEWSLADVATALWRSGVLCVIQEGLEEKGLGELLRSVSIFRELGDVRREVEATYWTGVGFSRCFLHLEAMHKFESVLAMGEKLGMFAELSLAYIGLGILNEYDGKLDEAIFDNLKASEHGKKTDALSGSGSSFGHLIRLYSKLGDLKHADEFSELVSKFGQEVRTHYLIAPDVAMTIGVRLAAKGQWGESNNVFERLLESLRTNGPSRPFSRVHAGINYAWALEKQGRFEEAKANLEKAQKIQQEVEARFEHSNIQAHLMVRTQAVVGEEFEMRFDFVNVGRKQCSVVKIEDAVPLEFNVVSLPSFCTLQNGCITLGDKNIDPFAVETIKVRISTTKPDSYNLNPKLFYTDDIDRRQTCELNQVTITVEQARPSFEVLPNRISTGYEVLDALLFGGFPKGDAVALVSPSSDERETIVRRFVEVGTQARETTFYLTTDPKKGKDLAEKYPEHFYLFVCNLQAEPTIHATPNVFRLKGVENLTEIDIALTKTLRTLSHSVAGSRRICIEAVSDVLLQHHAIMARKWLSALLPTLRMNGFTTLAVVDPQIHPAEELQAVLGVFDGEIRVTEKETLEGTKQMLKVRKLINQKYLDKEVILSKETLTI